MGVVTEYLIALAELVEAEGYAARRGLLKLAAASAILLLGLLTGGTGIGLLFWGLYETLRLCFGPAGAATTVGLAALAVTAGLVWWAKRVIA